MSICYSQSIENALRIHCILLDFHERLSWRLNIYFEVEHINALWRNSMMGNTN